MAVCSPIPLSHMPIYSACVSEGGVSLELSCRAQLKVLESPACSHAIQCKTRKRQKSLNTAQSKHLDTSAWDSFVL